MEKLNRRTFLAGAGALMGAELLADGAPPVAKSLEEEFLDTRQTETACVTAAFMRPRLAKVRAAGGTVVIPALGRAHRLSAHVWGRKYCATESFTAHPSPGSGRWMTTPFSLKAQGDSAYAQGVNRIIYHRFTHQPWPDDKYLPGMTMGRWAHCLSARQDEDPCLASNGDQLE